MHRLTISERSYAAAQAFAQRVVASARDRVAAIVLYGSVVRGEATADSDLDILVVAPHSPGLKDLIRDLREDLTREKGYRCSFSLQFLTPDELADGLRLGSPFLDNVLAEGVPLYDDGSYALIRSQTDPALH